MSIEKDVEHHLETALQLIAKMVSSNQPERTELYQTMVSEALLTPRSEMRSMVLLIQMMFLETERFGGLLQGPKNGPSLN